MVKALFAAGASADAKDPKKGVTALMTAALKGDGDVVLTLRNAGADANAQTYDDRTALMLAVMELTFNPRSEPHARLQRMIVKNLLTFGADLRKPQRMSPRASARVRQAGRRKKRGRRSWSPEYRSG